MSRKVTSVLMGVSLMPALAVVPSVADTITSVQVVHEGQMLSLSDLVANSFNTGAPNGGVIYNAGTVVINGTSQFNNNTGSVFGGVIANEETGTLTISNVGFGGNTGSVGAALYNLGDANFTGAALFGSNVAEQSGGAISNAGDLVFGGNAIFSSNSVTNGAGGAIANDVGGTITFMGNAEFSGNSASATDVTDGIGGAVLNNGVIKFNGKTTFAMNKSQNNGTAIHNGVTGMMNFNGGLTLSNNNIISATGVATSTVYNQGIISVIGGDVIVNGNTSHVGGGINSSASDAKLLLGAYYDDDDNVVVSKINNIIFQNNTALDGTAGALYAGDDTELYAKNILFNNNDSNLGGRGGAIALHGGTLKIIGDSNTFTNNDANGTTDVVENQFEFGGGAIQNMGNVTIGGVNSVNNFTSNTSAGYGGAIHVRASDASDIVSTILNGATSFAYNHAALHGGAISNYVDAGQSTLTFHGDTVFTNNTSDGLGGAIYNTGTSNGVITFDGNATFSGNSDGTGANDIYNDGTINFNGNVTLDGGITGSGTLALGNGKSLNIGNASLTQSVVTMNGGRIVARLGNVTDDYRINVGMFNGDGIIALTLADEGTYRVFGNSVFGDTVFEGEITFDSPLYNLMWTDELKSVTASRKTPDQIAANNGISNLAAGTVLNLMNSSSDVLNGLGMAAQERLALGDKLSVEKAARAIYPELDPVIQSVSTSVQTSIANLAAGRMALLQSSLGRSGGDAAAHSGVWAEGMYNKSKQNDMFNGYTRGLVAGMDTRIARGFMLGVGYSYSHSDVASIARDIEIDSNTIFVYGQYKPAAWYVNAMANYTMSDYVEKSDALGIDVRSDFDVDAIGAVVTTGYDFAAGITPEFGLRYMHIGAEEYKNSLGIKNKLKDSDYLTAMAGVKYAFDFRVSRALTLRPELRYDVKYDMLSEKHAASVVMPGVPSYVMVGDRLAPFSMDFGGGLVMRYQDFSFAFNYDIEVREDYTSQTGRVRARMVF